MGLGGRAASNPIHAFFRITDNGGEGGCFTEKTLNSGDLPRGDTMASHRREAEVGRDGERAGRRDRETTKMKKVFVPSQ